MGIGIGLLLVTVGAILIWAVDASIEAVNLDMVGVILIVAGTVGLLWGAIVAGQPGRTPMED